MTGISHHNVADGLAPARLDAISNYQGYLTGLCLYSNVISTGKCNKDVTPFLTHWIYVFLALTDRYDMPSQIYGKRQVSALLEHMWGEKRHIKGPMKQKVWPCVDVIMLLYLYMYVLRDKCAIHFYVLQQLNIWFRDVWKPTIRRFLVVGGNLRLLGQRSRWHNISGRNKWSC